MTRIGIPGDERAALAGRLRAVREALGMSQRALSERLSGSTRGWQDYESGRSLPGTAVLAQLQRLGVNINWVLTGEGEMMVREKALASDVPAKLDEEVHAHLIDGIIAVYREENVGLPPRDLGRLAARIHADLVAAYDDPDDRKVALKLALQHLRRDLRAAPTDGQSKRRA
ncbi:helix-turn-helix domain-containing protein [Roseospirillum parvum]|uniref:Helix-turn-helix domain-containing protein n=1 Tax=Roseospirillum parvum TaxID=83401 RepID=A0A1G8G4T4_9PROT|nr:helix-turn-helix transcriptional regulator [Roseospirillum parvum]SDH89369.1 Helix-turn-helix domain-containing protein [Roseospirillum parvum]